MLPHAISAGLDDVTLNPMLTAGYAGGQRVKRVGGALSAD